MARPRRDEVRIGRGLPSGLDATKHVDVILYKYLLHERVTWEIVTPRKLHKIDLDL